MEEIKVKINGGYLVAGKNMEPGLPGLYLVYQDDDGTVIDIATAQIDFLNKEKINVYCFEDVYTEDYTRRFQLDIQEIKKVI